jgi:hypothetical protein
VKTTISTAFFLGTCPSPPLLSSLADHCILIGSRRNRNIATTMPRKPRQFGTIKLREDSLHRRYFGRPGRTIVRDKLKDLVREYSIDLVLANGENAAAGFGITPTLAEDLFELGIDVMTTGNHIWDKREIIDYFNSADGHSDSPARRLLRPANYAPELPGRGFYEGRKNDVPYAVINLQGRVFMAANDDPFRKTDELLKQIKAKIVFVDIHAEPLGKNCPGMVSGWTRVSRGRDPYPRADCR